ncbi:hypothetical protein K2D_23630 [Planctomycetes bacterium K2D]|nr:hypothetical protein K2D_23630 [Planctomycetes bacterium K2D]
MSAPDWAEYSRPSESLQEAVYGVGDGGLGKP